MSRAIAPPVSVRSAFGLRGAPEPLTGGRGGAWRVGDVVLKPADTTEEALVWLAWLTRVVRSDSVRLARPRASSAGPYLVDGWTAAEFCPGRHERGRWTDIITVGRELHRSLAGIARPDFIDSNTDRWAVADRAAWGEIDLAPFRRLPHVATLDHLLEPVSAEPQVIHGDLTGNVLFSESLPPAVIDWAPYWRPAELATAIVVADAVCWEGATVADLGSDLDGEAFGQLLARALLFRIIADGIADPGPDRASSDARASAYRRGVELALRLIERQGTGP